MQIKIGSKLFVIFLVFKLFWYPNLYANESDLIIEIDNPTPIDQIMLPVNGKDR